MSKDEMMVSSAEEVMSDYLTDTKIVKVGKRNYRIKKFDPFNQCVLQVLSLPDFSGKDAVADKDVKDKAVKLMNDPKNRPELVKQAILSCTIEPPITDGEAKKENGKYVSISYDAMDSSDRMMLLAEIFHFSGFTSSKKEFFGTLLGRVGLSLDLIANRYKVLPHQLLKYPIDALGIDYSVALMAYEAELKAINQTNKKGSKVKKPTTKDEYRTNVGNLQNLYRMQ